MVVPGLCTDRRATDGLCVEVGEIMFETLLKFGLVALVWSGVGLVGVVIYFIYKSIKEDWF